uniref:Transthyretin-like family protein n=2 Tax=Bursaphelenchus xylophilus TaxID=6326 RepID=A0A1I7SHX8_BURXY
KVELLEQDAFKDDHQIQGRSDEAGHFSLSAKDWDWTALRPFVFVYHKCNADGACVRTRLTMNKSQEDVISQDFGAIELSIPKFPTNSSESCD